MRRAPLLHDDPLAEPVLDHHYIQACLEGLELMHDIGNTHEVQVAAIALPRIRRAEVAFLSGATDRAAALVAAVADFLDEELPPCRASS